MNRKERRDGQEREKRWTGERKEEMDSTQVGEGEKEKKMLGIMCRVCT
jgi:hypothetical protein